MREKLPSMKDLWSLWIRIDHITGVLLILEVIVQQNASVYLAVTRGLEGLENWQTQEVMLN